jgi:hypothetical protein
VAFDLDRFVRGQLSKGKLFNLLFGKCVAHANIVDGAGINSQEVFRRAVS